VNINLQSVRSTKKYKLFLIQHITLCNLSNLRHDVRIQVLKYLKKINLGDLSPIFVESDVKDDSSTLFISANAQYQQKTTQNRNIREIHAKANFCTYTTVFL
jgi:hypothetical protein